MSNQQQNEGEGNRTADRKYRKDTRKFIESGKVPEAADEARDAVNSGEKESLKRAEEIGKKPARH